MIDGFSIFDFNESAGGAANILQEKHSVFKFYLGVISAYALIKDENLIGTVSSDLSSFFFD